VAGPCEHCNDNSDSLKDGKLLGQLSYYFTVADIYDMSAIFCHLPISYNHTVKMNSVVRV
jgi:hypothetical protein